MTTITADLNSKNYVLGKGQVFFDRFANGVSVTGATVGEGERYFGNAPSFSTSSSAENLDHFSSEGGLKTKDSSVQLSLNRTGKMTCDNINAENIALFFQGSTSTMTQASATGVVHTVTAAKKGRFYQLGASASLPTGHRKVSNVVVKKGAGFTTTVVATGNYEVDTDLGRIYIESNAANIADEDIQITYDVAATTYEHILSANNAIYGAIRFVANNPQGTNRDYYFPYVKLAPDGDYSLIGDDWQSIGFTFEILKKASNIESAYIDGRPA